MSLIFGALADDLTGGMELAAMLVSQGVRCGFVTDPAGVAALVDVDAIVVAQKTRVVPAAHAVRAFELGARALQRRGARQLFFKYCATFDSTDDGNIGPCADLLRDMTGAAQVLFAPSFPEAGRRVFQGHLFADDMLISESPKRFDPLTPMLDPSLVRTLQRQTPTRVGLVPQQVVRSGLAALQQHSRALLEAGIGFAIADAAMPDDLAALAELSCEWPLMTGNSSIAYYYPPHWRRLGWLSSDAVASELPSVNGPAVVLSGSCAERSLDQLLAFERERPVLRLDLERAIDGVDVVAEAMGWACSALAHGPVAIGTSAPPDQVARVQARIGKHEAAALGEGILGRLAARLVEAGVRRFVVSGGETSGSVLEHLGVGRLQVGRYVAPGVARAVSTGETPIAFCLKSGKLGPVDMLLPMLASMEAA
ncbi:MAG: serine kinase [Rhizobacter sp.]|nr:serine kinase [Rhizobacter sp.]